MQEFAGQFLQCFGGVKAHLRVLVVQRSKKEFEVVPPGLQGEHLNRGPASRYVVVLQELVEASQ